MAGLGRPLGRVGVDPKRRLSPSKPSWPAGTARRKVRLSACSDLPIFVFDSGRCPSLGSEGPWVTPTSAEAAHNAGIVRAPVSCGTPCAAGGSDPRIKRHFTMMRCGRDHKNESIKRIRSHWRTRCSRFFLAVTQETHAASPLRLVISTGDD